MKAARWGKTDIVVELVKRGADIHMQNKVCCLFLHLALCTEGQGVGEVEKCRGLGVQGHSPPLFC